MGPGAPGQASVDTVIQTDRLTRKLWLRLRHLGPGALSKHKWAVDKGGGGRLGGLLKYGGRGGRSSWREEGPRLNGTIQYGSQPLVTCNNGREGEGGLQLSLHYGLIGFQKVGYKSINESIKQ